MTPLFFGYGTEAYCLAFCTRSGICYLWSYALIELLGNDLRIIPTTTFYFNDGLRKICFINEAIFALNNPEILTNFEFKLEFVKNQLLTPEVLAGMPKEMKAFTFKGVKNSPEIKKLNPQFMPLIGVKGKEVCIGTGVLR